MSEGIKLGRCDQSAWTKDPIVLADVCSLRKKVINLTPHDITFRTKGDAIGRIFRASRQVARATQSDEDAPEFDRMPTVRRTMGSVEGVPAPEPGVTYIVSAFCLPSLAGREDVVAPDTGPGSAIRGDDGQIAAVQRWIRPDAEGRAVAVGVEPADWSDPIVGVDLVVAGVSGRATVGWDGKEWVPIGDGWIRDDLACLVSSHMHLFRTVLNAAAKAAADAWPDMN